MSEDFIGSGFQVGTALSLETFRKIKIFDGLDDLQLTEAMRVGNTVTFEALTNILIEGEISGGLYVIIEGHVGVFKTNKLSGNLLDIGQLKAGQFFGEMSFIDDNPRSASVRALTDCKLYYLAKHQFMEFLRQSPETKIKFYENCIQDLISRLRILDENYIISQYQLWKTAMKKESA